jgi:transcriptional regulator with XRE-family HTH domain
MVIAHSSDEDVEAELRRDFGRRIVQMRMERGMSQIDFARKLGIDRSRLGKWERGLHSPSFAQLLDLAKVLEASLDELLAGKKPTAKPGQKTIDSETLASVLMALNGLM